MRDRSEHRPTRPQRDLLWAICARGSLCTSELGWEFLRWRFGRRIAWLPAAARARLVKRACDNARQRIGVLARLGYVEAVSAPAIASRGRGRPEKRVIVSPLGRAALQAELIELEARRLNDEARRSRARRLRAQRTAERAWLGTLRRAAA